MPAHPGRRQTKSASECVGRLLRPDGHRSYGTRIAAGAGPSPTGVTPMSIVDKVIAAVTPPESDEARAEAREKARAAARPGSWLELALDHHLLIEDLVAAVRSASAPAARL